MEGEEVEDFFLVSLLDVIHGGQIGEMRKTEGMALQR